MTTEPEIAADRLRSFVQCIERNEEEKSAIADDTKKIYAEAKAAGFDVATIKQIVKIRKLSREKLQEQEELLDLYKTALGIV